MTIRLTYVHVLIVLVVAAIFALAIGIMVKNIQKQNVVDAERLQQIDKLQDEVKELKRQAEDMREMADGLREQRDDGAAALAELRQRLHKLRETPTPTPMTEAEERVVCLKYVVLLEDNLRLADQETLALRKELGLVQMALDYTEERYQLQSSRLRASQKANKRTKRRNVWTITSVAAASVVLGFGIGRI